MNKSLLTILTVLMLTTPTPSNAAVATTCEEVCAGCATCKIFTDGGYNCTGCPRETLKVDFNGEGAAQISVNLDEEVWKELGFQAAPAGLTLAAVPGIFSVDSSRVISMVDGSQTAIFEITLAPGTTPEMVLGSLRSEGYLTINSPSEVGEVLLSVEDLLSASPRLID